MCERFRVGSEVIIGVWPTCYACGEDIEVNMYTLFGNDYCESCAREIVKDNEELMEELLEDYLRENRTTPTYRYSIDPMDL